MATVQIMLELPEKLVYDAREFGILNQEVIIELLQKELDRQVMAFVNNEIHAHRTEKRDVQKGDDASPLPPLQ